MQNYDDTCPNPYEDYVYNIEVADNHTYFVGQDGVWVHNCGGEDDCQLTVEQLQAMLPAMQYWIDAGVSEQELTDKLAEYQVDIQTLSDGIAAVTNHQNKR